MKYQQARFLLVIVGLAVVAWSLNNDRSSGAPQHSERQDAAGVAAQGATPVAAVCSAWQLPLTVALLVGATPDATDLRAARSVVRQRVAELELFQAEYITGGKVMTDVTDDAVILAEIWFRIGRDIPERRESYQRLLILPGEFAIIDPLEQDLTPGAMVNVDGAALRAGQVTPDGTASPIVPGPYHPVVVEGADLWYAYPTADAASGALVVFVLTPEAIPVLEAHLDGRRDRRVAIVIDRTVVGIASLDPDSVSIAIGVADHDQADFIAIAQRSGPLKLTLLGLEPQPVFSDECV